MHMNYVSPLLFKITQRMHKHRAMHFAHKFTDFDAREKLKETPWHIFLYMEPKF